MLKSLKAFMAAPFMMAAHKKEPAAAPVSNSEMTVKHASVHGKITFHTTRLAASVSVSHGSECWHEDATVAQSESGRLFVSTATYTTVYEPGTYYAFTVEYAKDAALPDCENPGAEV